MFSQGMKLLLGLFIFATPALSAQANWLPREIHEIRAYVYDYTQEVQNLSLLRQGKLHRGIINLGGAKLSEDQMERLKEAIRSKEMRIPGAFCYLPHHGFVFFDKEGKAMGHIELCFQCGNVASSPKGLPEREWNWQEIRKLLEELKIPILNEDEEYTKLYQETQARREQGGTDQPLTTPDSKSQDPKKPQPESEDRPRSGRQDSESRLQGRSPP